VIRIIYKIKFIKNDVTNADILLFVKPHGCSVHRVMFSRKDVKHFINKANLPNFNDKNVLIASLSKDERRKIQQKPSLNVDQLPSIDIQTNKAASNIEQQIEESNVDQRIAATVEIQRWWRGSRTRAILYSILHPCISSHHGSSMYLPMSIASSQTLSELRDSMNTSRLSIRLHSSISKQKSKIALCYESYYVDAIQEQKIDKERLLTFQGYCALAIQAWWRHRVSQKKEERQEAKASVAVIKKQSSNLSIDDASNIIQKTWRRHIDLQVFKYYKKLINFQNKGDPQFILKCINPKESELLDNAAGVHIRFRLGGIKFPPSIYYKIYSHINVADIGSFAPRYYTHQQSKQLPGKFIHNNGGLETIANQEEIEWYKRCENNGWRPVNQRLSRFLTDDTISYNTSQKKINYHHEKLVRQQDVASRKKEKKLNWMRKMYSLGVLKVRSTEDVNVKELVNTAAESIFNTMKDENSVENIEDWEVNELLQWTQGLNFDNYSLDWWQEGTTHIQTSKVGKDNESNKVLNEEHYA